jgi:hypothetical protein
LGGSVGERKKKEEADVEAGTKRGAVEEKAEEGSADRRKPTKKLT